jgi:LPS-assembly lipoprotein
VNRLRSMVNRLAPMPNRRNWMAAAVRLGAGLVVASALGGCGFQLRSSSGVAFETIAVTPNTKGTVAAGLRRALGGKVREPQVAGVSPQADKPPQVTLDILSEQREKTVVALNASGQVREFQLRIRIKFRLRDAQGKDLIPETEILQQRDISFNESAVLAKEAEEGLLYRDMQTDIVQQLMRRLAAVSVAGQ